MLAVPLLGHGSVSHMEDEVALRVPEHSVAVPHGGTQMQTRTPLPLEFGPQICADFDQATSREWLETNGLGGFAASTICGLNTRRYHALLVAATKPPVGRMALLSKLEETLVVGNSRFELSANQYPGAVHPQGYQYLKAFRLDPFPVFTYEVNGVVLQKSVFMVHGENSTVVEYRVAGGAAHAPELRLEIAPLIAFRDYHSTTHENGMLNRAVNLQPGLASVTPYPGLPELYLAHDASVVEITGHWYRNFEYRIERERGLDYSEDLFNPLVLKFNLSQQPSAAIIASTTARKSSDARQLRTAETERRNQCPAPKVEDHFVRRLAAAADQYIVQRGDHKTIIAGYPWFSDWGRDTMIALPGLTLATGRPEVARDILLAFAASVDQGMLPNRFPDAGENPEYNTVDASLWFFEAIRAYLSYTGDFDFVRTNLYPVLTGIIDWHVRGTRHGIKVDASGLLTAGAPGVQLTWMDAKIGDWVVTPRHGKPVEIQALWYNALRIMESLALQFGDEQARKRYMNMAALTKSSFNRLFWNESAGCLYDVVNGGPPDASIRPNQLLAVSLHHAMLSPECARAVVEVVQRELLTPYGLRTLSRDDSRYAAHYGGDGRSRDAAYHQGTVWPWLLGPFITAYVKVHHGSQAAREQSALWLQPLRQHLTESGLGQISEVFDAEPPYRPGGCFAQAWSAGELLRAMCDDVLALRGRGGVQAQPPTLAPQKAAGTRAV